MRGKVRGKTKGGETNRELLELLRGMMLEEMLHGWSHRTVLGL